jgi:hypothetical protein
MYPITIEAGAKAGGQTGWEFIRGRLLATSEA